MMITCDSCGAAILDRNLMKVDGKLCHQSCVKCSVCAFQLVDRCYAKDGKLYCTNDFSLRFRPKCLGCNLPLCPSDFVHKLPKVGGTSSYDIYHLSCFVCSICRCILKPGTQYRRQNDCFFCPQHYYKLMANEDSDYDTRDTPSLEPGEDLSTITQGEDFKDANIFQQNTGWDSPGPSEDGSKIDVAGYDYTLQQTRQDNSTGHESLFDGNDSRKSQERQDVKSPHTEPILPVTTCAKRRGPRTTIKAAQLAILNNTFSSTRKPSRHIREKLAEETGLSMRVIQVWFQNRRSKERRQKDPLNRRNYSSENSNSGFQKRVFPDAHTQLHFYHPVITSSPGQLDSLRSQESLSWPGSIDYLPLLGAGNEHMSNGCIATQYATSLPSNSPVFFNSTIPQPGQFHSSLPVDESLNSRTNLIVPLRLS